MPTYGPAASADFIALPKNTYELIVLGVDVVPNDKGEFAYKAGDNENKKDKFLWTFLLRNPVEVKTKDGSKFTIKDRKITRKTPSYWTTHAKNNTTNFCREIDQAFDPKVGYKNHQDFLDHVKGKGIRGFITVGTYVKDGETKEFNSVDSLMPSELPSPSASDLETALRAMGATEIPAGKDF